MIELKHKKYMYLYESNCEKLIRIVDNDILQIKKKFDKYFLKKNVEQIEKQYIECLNVKSSCLLKLHHTNEALVILEEIEIELNKTNRTSLIFLENYIKCLIYLRKSDKLNSIVDLYEKVLKYKGEVKDEIIFYKGVISYNNGKIKKASNYFKEYVIKENSTFIDYSYAYLILCNLLESSSFNEKTIEYYFNQINDESIAKKIVEIFEQLEYIEINFGFLSYKSIKLLLALTIKKENTFLPLSTCVPLKFDNRMKIFTNHFTIQFSSNAAFVIDIGVQVDNMKYLSSKNIIDNFQNDEIEYNDYLKCGIYLDLNNFVQELFLGTDGKIYIGESKDILSENIFYFLEKESIRFKMLIDGISWKVITVENQIADFIMMNNEDYIIINEASDSSSQWYFNKFDNVYIEKDYFKAKFFCSSTEVVKKIFKLDKINIDYFPK